jgi:hypothetical protein
VYLNSTTPGVYYGILGNRTSGGDPGLSIAIANSNEFVFDFLGTNGEQIIYRRDLATYFVAGWNFVAYVRDAANISGRGNANIFINGTFTPVGAGGDTLPPSSGTDFSSSSLLRMGYRQNFNRYFNGKLNDFIIQKNLALDEKEIRHRYNSGWGNNPGNLDNLEVWWRMNQYLFDESNNPSNTKLLDFSNNNIEGDMYNFANNPFERNNSNL